MAALRGRYAWTRFFRSFIAPVVAVTLVGSLTTAPMVSAASLVKPPVVQKVPQVPVTARSLSPRPAPHNPPDAAKATAWPVAGDADVAVPAPAPPSADKTLSAVPPRVAVPGIPASLRRRAQLGTPRNSATVAPVHVHLADQQAARQAGVAGVLFTVSGATDGVSVDMDYSAFKDALGAGWGSRLRLVQLPDCALTTPTVPACQIQTPVAGSTNDPVTHTVSADVPVASASLPRQQSPMSASATASAGTVVMAATAGSSGSSGTFEASSLSPSGAWSVSGSSGAFTWSYPLAGPPVSAGSVAPNVALSYNSQAVDGLTAGTNNQVSWVGEGFDYEPGYVERVYRACADDTTLPAEQQTGDRCWVNGGKIINLNLGGQTVALVQDDATGAWHPASDTGDRVEHLTGATNGALNGEYWKVTTTDGTQYYFGRDSGPGYTNQETTKSTWTLPVYGAHPGDPCYNPTGFGSSSCTQAWRWNLDYAEDTHGNVTMYYYAPETNFYGANNGTNGVPYVRGGYVTHIDYGLRNENGTVYSAAAPDQYVFTVGERCDQSGGFQCTDANFTTANALHWPDVPVDQNCAQGAVCNTHTPTFWSRKMLNTVTTQYYTGTAYTTLDSWSLAHLFYTASDPSLWLSGITRTGYAADHTLLSQPALSFTGVVMDNRVAGYNGQPSMSRWRMSTITAETGQQTVITYSAPECTATNVPADPAQDTMRCFPVYWNPPLDKNPVLDYFHKYVTTEVDVQDPNKLSPTHTTTYTYLGTPAWHFDDNEIVKPANRTYGQFRGYGQVEARTGGGTEQKTLARTTYFRGMNGDTLPGGATRNATVTNSLGETVPDTNDFMGNPWESQTFNGDGGTELTATVTDPVVLAVTATRARTGLPSLTAGMVRDQRTRKITDLGAGGTRTQTVTSIYDNVGREVRKTDAGDGVPTLCTGTSYADDTGAWIRNLASETVVSQQTCPAPGTAQAPVVSDTRIYYDGATTLGSITKGDSTRTEQAVTNNNGTLTFGTTATATFDASGRPLTSTDALNHTTSTTYTPADGGILTQKVITNALNQTVTQTLDPGRGTITSIIDVAGHRTDLTYDQLGRTTAVWQPGRSKAQGAGANTIYTYLLRTDGPEAVTTQRLVDTGTSTGYVTSVELFDAMGQSLQTQADAEGGGRVVADKFYDTHGWATRTNNRYYTSGAPTTTVASVADSAVNDRTINSYDGAGRVTLATEYNGTTPTWTTRTVYGGDRTTTFPPSGGVITTTVTDIRGHTTEARQYTAAPTVNGSVVSGGTYQSTSYQFDPMGRTTTVTDPNSDVWAITYDLLGHALTRADPVSGTSQFVYDLNGQVTSATDARGQTLAYTYDALNRKTGEYSGSTSGTQLASWLYDTVQRGKVTSTTRYTPNGNYVTGVQAYDATGNATRTYVQLPTSEAGLGGNTYLTKYTYTTTGLQSSVTPVVAGGLVAESIVTHYDALGNPIDNQGYNTYLGAASYTAYGEPLQYTLGVNASTAWLSYGYDAQTRRVTNVNLSAQTTTRQIDDTTYSYDPAGNVTRSVDVQGPAGSPTQTQCNTYDALRRLVESWTATDNCAQAPQSATIGGPQPFWESWTFDAIGRRLTQTQHAVPGQSGDSTTTYSYPAAGQPQPTALSGTTTTGPSGTTTAGYTYDASGNQTTRTSAVMGNQTLSWDGEGRLATVNNSTVGTTSYVYDADGTQLLRRDPNTTTLFLPGEEITYNSATQATTGVRYYTVGKQTVAMRSGGAAPVYLCSDPHSTVATTYNPDNGTVTRRTMEPYGNQIGATTVTVGGATTPGPWPDQHGFLGKPLDTTTGLTDIGARKYDAATGRFISVDPILDVADPQSMTGYGYADNNPVSGSDPSGLLMIDGCGVQNTACLGDQVHAGKSTSNNGAPPASDVGRQSDDAAVDQVLAGEGISQDQINAARATKKRSISDELLTLASDLLKGLIGYDDIKRCVNGDFASCLITVVTNLPWTKVISGAQKVLRFIPRALQIIQDFRREEQAADRVLHAVVDAERDVAEERRLADGCIIRNSFPGDTRVAMADGSRKPIDQVRVGDVVTNGQAGGMAGGGDQRHVVTAVHVTYTDRDYTDVTVDTGHGRGTVTGTAGHLYWDATTGLWTRADTLRVGDRLQTEDGATVSIINLRDYTATMVTYNLTIDQLHTYYVLAGNTPVLVHNTDGLQDPIGLGPGYTARMDKFPVGQGVDFEIHVYYKGSEIGIYGSNGWFAKHGKSADVSVPESVENRLKGKAIEFMRGSGRIGPKGTEDISGDKWMRPRLTGGC
ncbi:type IV secretion protein Rhs [Amycolatopsis rhizosphaerae]|uniref:Type IV secretion protein Rhs n=1 Tax=Amycolatopsis rhizosphaerae TaxID=2053003 RepID=A0A558C7E6_9PSEU|nr:RHS repeat-associated core domain-containing protein [Amycolatopsis rhizosphaerae]TVT44607.1 type IV secretion protein Rhs [Amycolatopsis rhizosphaerae]